jgi:protocatechuate 3,4-dioxygenase beta subunit
VSDRKRDLTSLAAAIALLGMVAVHGQTARPSIDRAGGRASIRGRVLAAQTGTPLRNARIELQDVASRVVSTVLTDGEGRFVLTSISAGVYTLAVASRRVRHPGDDGATNDGGRR